MRSTKAKKTLVFNKTIIKVEAWFTGKSIRPIVTEPRDQATKSKEIM